METKDFTVNHENDWNIFEGETDIFGKKTSILLDVGNMPADENTLAKVLSELNRKIQFIDDNRNAIEQCMLDDDMLELAEEWASSAEEADDTENCFIMEDGQRVYLPITETDFRNSLYLDGINFDYAEDTGKISADLFFNCSPDYFAYHSIEIFIDEDNEISCNSLAG